jgi:hypothetical protein
MNNLSGEETKQIILDETNPLYEGISKVLKDKRPASVIMAMAVYMAQFSLSAIASNPGKFTPEEALDVLHEQTMSIINRYLSENPELADKLRK